jgi:hypothetical protein
MCTKCDANSKVCFCMTQVCLRTELGRHNADGGLATTRSPAAAKLMLRNALLLKTLQPAAAGDQVQQQTLPQPACIAIERNCERSVRHSIGAPVTEQKVPPRPQNPPWIYVLCASPLVYVNITVGISIVVWRCRGTDCHGLRQICLDQTVSPAAGMLQVQRPEAGERVRPR